MSITAFDGVDEMRPEDLKALDAADTLQVCLAATAAVERKISSPVSKNATATFTNGFWSGLFGRPLAVKSHPLTSEAVYLKKGIYFIRNTTSLAADR